MLLASNPEPFTSSEEEKAAVHEQMERLLAHPHFKHSRRFPSLLRFVVDHTLAGRPEDLKERTLGVEIFGKPAHYDTANDPIVRVTAAEIRKRLALYYGEPEHEAELRISLPAGSYVPRFTWPKPLQPLTASTLDQAFSPQSRHEAELPANFNLPPSAPLPKPIPLAPQPAAPTELWTATRRRSRVRFALLVSLLLCLAISGPVWWRLARPNPVQTFWKPLLDATDPVLFCVADQTEYTDIQLRDAAQPSHQSVLHDNLTAVVIDDVPPIADIAGILRQNGKRYTIRGEGATTLNDLRGGPAVFIGAYDNAWTLRLLEPLRFHFANSPDMSRFWIVDAASGKPTPWVVNRREQIATNIYRDYAIISRFTDSDTGRLAVVVAGIGRGGTIAAGEFLTTPALLQAIGPFLGKGKAKNLELVLSTQIIGGQPGAPRIEASYTW